MTPLGSIARRLRWYALRVSRWRSTARQRRDAAFAAEGLDQLRRGLQIFCIFGLAMLIASAIDSYVSEPDYFALLFRIRLAGMTGLLGIFALLRMPLGARWPRPLGLAFVVVVCTMMHALAIYTGGQASPQYDRVNLVLLGLAVFATWSAAWTALACGLAIGVYVLGTATAGGFAANQFVLHNLSRILTASVVAVGATAVRERLRWQAFCNRRALVVADAQRRESEHRYQLVVETAGSAIVMLSPDRRIVEFNHEAEITYGRPRHEVIGEHYPTLLLPEARRPAWEALVERVLAGEEIRAYEAPVRSRRGERHILAWNVSRVCATDGEPLAVLAIGHDITQRQRAEGEVQRLNAELEQRVQLRTAELRASEERFRTIFDSAPIGIMTADRAGRVGHANRAFEAMLGYGAGELEGRVLDDLVAEPDRERSRKRFEQVCAGIERELSTDKRYVGRDGGVIAVHEAFAVVRDPDGRFAYGLAMVEDVSEQQRAEARARQHQEHLAHVLRVSTMGEMAAELAHEMNQPLGAIANYANGTLVRLRARGIAPDIEAAVEQIAGEAMRAGEIIRRIREFVRQGDSRRELSDLNNVVRQAAHLVEADARGQAIPVRLVLETGLPAVEIDRIQVEQVIVNLLRNAIDAIVADHQQEDEVLVKTGRGADGVLEVGVRDTGVGVPPTGSGRIFDAFFTTKRGGLGMGLSISRSIVEAHGGRLWATANRDRGMTFTFSLPLAQGRRVAAA